MFSIITITYNRRGFLAKAIASVLAQNIPDLEYIIVDDGSTDGTEELIKEIQDSRLRYISCEHSGRLSVLRNRGLEEARGNLIAFLDSDDVFDPGYLERLQALYANPAVTSVVSNAIIRSELGPSTLFKEHELARMNKNLLAARLKNQLIIYPSCFSFRAGTEKIRFNEQLKYGDSDLFQRMLANGQTVINASPLVTIVKHADNMSEKTGEHPAFLQSYSEEFQTLQTLLNEKHISTWRYARTRSAYYYKLGLAWQQLKRNSNARESYRRAFSVFPFNVRALMRFIQRVIN